MKRISRIICLLVPQNVNSAGYGLITDNEKKITESEVEIAEW